MRRREPSSDRRRGSLPAARPHSPLQPQAPRLSALLPPPLSITVRINKIIKNSLAKANSQRAISVAPLPPRPRTVAFSGNVDSDPSLALSLPHPPSAHRSSPRSPRRPRRQAETWQSGEGSGRAAAGGKPRGSQGESRVRGTWIPGCTHARTHTHTFLRALTRTNAPKEAAKTERRPGGGGGRNGSGAGQLPGHAGSPGPSSSRRRRPAAAATSSRCSRSSPGRPI